MRIIRRYLLRLLLLLIPCRDWSFDVGISFYAIDIVLLVVAFDYLISAGRRFLSKFDVVYLSTGVPGILALLPLILISDFELVLFGVIGLVKFLLYVVGFFWTRDLYREGFYRRSVNRLLFSSFIVFSIIALINFYTLSSYDVDFLGDFFDSISVRPSYIPPNHLQLTYWIRNTSFAGEPNFLAIWSILTYLFLIKTKSGRLFNGLLLLLCGLVTISTFSRIALGILVVLFLSYMYELFSKRKVVFLSLLMAFVPLVSSNVVLDDRVKNIIESAQNRNYSGDDGRLEIFNQSFEIFLSNPFGSALSNYGRVARRFGLSYEPNPHNSYLIWLVEGGVLGIAAFGMFLLSILRNYFLKFGLRETILVSAVLLALFVNVFDKVFGYFLLLVLPLTEKHNAYD
jgi:hypothetical protein